MSLRARIKGLEKKQRLKLTDATVATCAGCAIRQITLHHEYELPDGETITLPPIPPTPPCTCGQRRNDRQISLMIFNLQAESREDAERHAAKHAERDTPWRPDAGASDY